MGILYLNFVFEFLLLGFNFFSLFFSTYCTFSPNCPAGISSETILKSSNTSEEELLDLIYKLNTDHQVDGLLVQLPLPGRCSTAEPFT